MPTIKFIKDTEKFKEGEIAEASKNSSKSYIENGYAILIQNKELTKPEKADVKLKSKIFKKEKKKAIEKEDIIDVCEFTKQWILEENKSPIPKYKLPEIQLTNKFSPKPFADELIRFHHFKYDNFHRFWIYDPFSGLWKEDAEEFIKKMLRAYIFGEHQLRNNYVNEVVNHIKDLSWTRDIPEDIDKNILAFNNCFVNLETGEIKPFSEDYFITSKVNIDLDPQYKECPKIEKFFEDVVGVQNKGILFDLIAYCFYRCYPYQKMFILHGSGENGKTTYLDLLTHILGVENISSETPQELSLPSGFSKGNLWKKFANISSELPYTELDDTNTIKGLCGGDLIKCNRKFKEPFQFRNFAKLIFAGNELPATNDKTYAFARRLYIIKFDKKIHNPIKDYINQLLNPKELSGLAWKCFKKLQLQRERGWSFEIDVDVEEMLKLYEELSNPLSKFLKEEISEDCEGFVFKYEFKDEFEGWCKKKGFRVWSDKELGNSLKQLYSDGKRSTWINGEQKRYNAWLGISFKNKQNLLIEKPKVDKMEVF